MSDVLFSFNDHNLDERDGAEGVQPAPVYDDRLILPRGAWIGLRKSGGMVFSTRTIVVYRDGRVRSEASGILPPGRWRAVRRLDIAGLQELGEALAAVDPGSLPARVAASPDGFVYELAVRANRRTRRAELADGAMPPAAAALVARLRALAGVE